MVAIAQQIVLGLRAPALRVEREAGDQIVHVAARHGTFRRDHRQPGEGRVLDPGIAAQRLVRASADIGEAGERIIGRAHRAAMVLPVGNVVTGAAPGVEQPCPLACHRIEQTRGRAETLGAARDAVPCMGDEDGAAHACT